MRLRTRRDAVTAKLPFDHEHVPGLGVVSKLDRTRRWQLAGEYAARHRMTGPWYRRVCVSCATKGRCEYGRWADDILIGEANREWLGR